MNLSVPLEIKENPEIFKGKKVFVMGDIAFDHSYYCRPSQRGFHAYHAKEQIFDIEPWGDDQGSVGSANNINLFVNSFNAASFLLTVIGKDSEGEKVKKLLKADGVRNKCIKLPGVQTITRIRFFIYDEKDSEYQLAYRMDKEPDYNLSNKKSLNYIRKSKKVKELLEQEIRSCDTFIVNDTEKGFISDELMGLISQIISEENNERKLKQLPQINIIADPKNHWNKFRSLPGVIIKPNLKEALKELDYDPDEQKYNPEDLSVQKNIAAGLVKKYGRTFSNYIITLGRYGVLFISLKEDKIEILRLPVFHSQNSIIKSAAHCGDIFSAALGLSLTLKDADILSSIIFANWAAFVQYNKYGKEKAGMKDFQTPESMEYISSYNENLIQKTELSM